MGGCILPTSVFVLITESEAQSLGLSPVSLSSKVELVGIDNAHTHKHLIIFIFGGSLQKSTNFTY